MGYVFVESNPGGSQNHDSISVPRLSVKCQGRHVGMSMRAVSTPSDGRASAAAAPPSSGIR